MHTPAQISQPYRLCFDHVPIMSSHYPSRPTLSPNFCEETVNDEGFCVRASNKPYPMPTRPHLHRRTIISASEHVKTHIGKRACDLLPDDLHGTQTKILGDRKKQTSDLFLDQSGWGRQVTDSLIGPFPVSCYGTFVVYPTTR